MAKNFGMNSKAEEGRARKAEAKEKEKLKTRTEKEKLEEKKWSEGSKDESKRQQEEAKRLEKLIKKQEKKQIEDQESQELAKYKPSANKSKSNANTPEPLFRSKSFNWTLSQSSEGDQSTESLEKFSASNMDDALMLLESTNTSSVSLSTVEKHPERRMKAAFSAFEARELPILRADNPTLKHSQLLERLHKLWKKSPENPFNQLHVSHNMSQEKQTDVIKAEQDRNLNRLRIN